jgi:hypothetical protein
VSGGLRDGLGDVPPGDLLGRLDDYVLSADPDGGPVLFDLTYDPEGGGPWPWAATASARGQLRRSAASSASAALESLLDGVFR